MPRYLTGRLLIASPSMDDPRFEHSIILICSHDEEQALGIILNRKVPYMTLPLLLEDLGFENAIYVNSNPVLDGGPCQPERGFVIHSKDWRQAETIDINDKISMSVSKEILNSITDGTCPKKYIVALGYAGWGPGQLEEELAGNSWLITEPYEDIVFSTHNLETKWRKVLELIGLDPSRISAQIGHA